MTHEDLTSHIRQRLERELAELRKRKRDASDAELAPPKTLREALAVVKREADGMAAELTRHIVYFVRALGAPELTDAVLAHPEVGDLWPWPEPWPKRDGVRVEWTLWAELRDNLDPTRTLEHTRESQREHNDEDPRPVQAGDLWRYWWPSDATTGDVAKWAQRALNRLADGRGDAELAKAKAGHMLMNPPLVVPEGEVLSGGAMALLFLAERVARIGHQAAPDVFLLSVERAPVRTLTSLAGAHPEKTERTAAVRRHRASDDLLRLKFHWPDRDPTQLDLEDMSLPAGATPLVAVAHAYGDAAVRDMLALYLFSWVARAPAGAGVWWWPDEHLEVVGLNPRDKDNQRRLRELLDRLKRSRLEARYRTGRPLVGPVVAEVLTDGVARKLHLHSAMYRGVTSEEGDPGNYWWAMPTEMLRLPTNRTAGRVHVLGPVLARKWRAAWSKRKRPGDMPEARVDVERLADSLAIQGTQRRQDPRAADTLRASLEAGKSCGLVKSWRVERGNLDRLTGTLYVTPGEQALEVLRTATVPKPAWIPATGADLARWLPTLNISRQDVAKWLGIGDRTLRRLTNTHRSRPLPTRVRAALRRYLWVETEDE